MNDEATAEPQTCADVDAENQALFKGQCVVLKGGGQVMTVVGICVEDIAVAWFDRMGDLREEEFPAWALRVVPHEPESSHRDGEIDF